MDWQKLAVARGNEIEDLKEKVKYLQDLLAPACTFPPEWNLAPRETQMLSAIARTGEATFDHLIELMGNGAGENLVRQYAYRLRRRLKPFGIEIHNTHRAGYFVEGQSKDIVQRHLRRVPEVEKREQRISA